MSDNEEWGYWRSSGKSHVWNMRHGSREEAERLRYECVKWDDGFVRGPVQRKSDPNPFEVKSPEAVAVAVAVDDVNQPAHYTSHPSGTECLDIVRHFNFNIGNVIKYCWRAGLKTPDPLKDLKKARFYIDDEIKRLEKQK